MDPSQQTAIDTHMKDLTESLKPEALVLLAHLQSGNVISFDEREKLEKSSILSLDQVQNALLLIKEKDNGWAFIIDFLKSNHRSHWANTLISSADNQVPTVPTVLANPNLVKFISLLVQHYLHEYAEVLTMWNVTKMVNDVWVPIQMKGECFEDSTVFGNAKLLKLLRSTDGRNVAIISGDAGTGKTTMVKKMAYDWATDYGSNDGQFSMVLAVPLKSVQPTDDFIQLTVNYFLEVLSFGEKLRITESDKTDLITCVKLLGTEVLLMLDGLMEYPRFRKNPFTSLCARPHGKKVESATVPTFKLLVTSRNLAESDRHRHRPMWQSFLDDLSLFNFPILPFDSRQALDFASRYCETAEGLQSTTNYLTSNRHLSTHVPVALTIVCHLAELKVTDIPTSLTGLYDIFIEEMLKKAEGKLREKIAIDRWKESQLVLSTVKVAYDSLRCHSYLTEFHLEHINNDSYLCGFLLRQPATPQVRRVLFAHRFVQEYLAALHAYQLVLDGQDISVITGNLLAPDSQFGRFVFGISCKEERGAKFGEIIRNLQFSFNTCYHRDIGSLLNSINLCLPDCTDENGKQIGQSLYSTLSLITSKPSTVTEKRSLIWNGTKLRSLQSGFASGLNLKTVNASADGIITDWFMQSEEGARIAGIAVLAAAQPELFAKQLDKAELFIWSGWLDNSSHIDQLLPVKSMIVSAGLDIQTNFTLMYEQVPQQEMTTFIFLYNKEDTCAIRDILDQCDTVKLAAEETTTPRTPIVVTIDLAIAQSTLIHSLIKLALK